MKKPVNTKKVTGRRTLRFGTLAQALAELGRLERCGEVQSLGNWSPGQNLSHLARTMDSSIDGFPSRFPLPLRILGRLARGRILSRPFPVGFRMPRAAQAVLLPPEMSFTEGAAEFREAIARLNREPKRVPSPFLGELTIAQWEQFHCRHAELHLGFLVSVELPASIGAAT